MLSKAIITQKPKWYQLRLTASTMLINLARLIHPANPEVLAYYTDLMIELAITGRVIQKVSFEDYIKENEIPKKQ